MPIDPETSKADGVARLETIADHALPGWRSVRRIGWSRWRTPGPGPSIFPARPGKTGQRLIAAPASISSGTGWLRRAAERGQPEQRCQGCPASSGLTMSINAWQPWSEP